MQLSVARCGPRLRLLQREVAAASLHPGRSEGLPSVHATPVPHAILLLCLQRFPDAMSKTVPIWAAVMNRAVARLRGFGGATVAAAAGQAATAAGQGAALVGDGNAAAGAAAAAAGSICSPPEDPWDCDVHLPPWVSEVEANSIRQRLEGWADRLLEVSSFMVVIIGV